MFHVNVGNHRRRDVMRLGLYGLASLLVLACTALLVSITQGYDIDRQTGEVVQNGVILVESQPRDARIFRDGLDEGTTPESLPLLPGEYSLALRRTGYRPWTRTVAVESAEVNWLYYPLLIPATLKPELLAVPDKRVIFSPSGQYGVYSRRTEGESVRLQLGVLDLQGDGQILFADLPDVLQAIDFDSVQFHDWSQNDTRALISVDNQLVEVYLLEPANSRVVLTGDSPIIDAQYYLDSDEILVQTQNSLSVLDGSNRNIAGKYSSFDCDGSNCIAIVQAQSDQYELRYSDDFFRSVSFLTTAGESDVVRIQTYEDDTFITVLSTTQFTMYQLERSNGKPQLQIVQDVPVVNGSYLGVVNETRFSAVQHQDGLSIFDFEELAVHTHAPALFPYAWSDGHRLHSADGNGIFIIDFDGSNKYYISERTQVAQLRISKDMKHIYYRDDIGLERVSLTAR